MFDIGATELLLIIVVAVIVIGPKDMPMALRTAGRWIGKVRRISGQFRAGLDAMVREAEMEEMQKEWDRRNAEIMARHPDAEAETGKLEGGDGAEPGPVASDATAESPPEPAQRPKPESEAGMEPLPLFDEAQAKAPAKSGGDGA